MPKPSKAHRRWLIVAALALACAGAVNLAIAKSTLSLNSPASFPVDI